jgi:hypothetical protein
LIPLSIAHEITKSFILSRSIIILLTVRTYDYDQRHWRKIYGPEELNKIELLTGIPADEIIPSNNKPTVRIQKRMGSLKAASVRHKGDRADKVLRLLTGNI